MDTKVFVLFRYFFSVQLVLAGILLGLLFKFSVIEAVDFTQKNYTQLVLAPPSHKKNPKIVLSASQIDRTSILSSVPLQYRISSDCFVFDCSDKQTCKEVKERCRIALTVAHNQGDFEKEKRLEKRLEALNSNNSKALKNVLHQEFITALDSSVALLRRFSGNIQLYVAHGLAVGLAQKAVIEKELGMVCSYADTVHDLVTLAKIATGALRGVYRGIKHTMTVEHAKQLIQGTAHFVKAMAQRFGEFIEVAPLLQEDFALAEQTMTKFENDNGIARKAFYEHCAEQITILKETSWEKIAEVGAEFGTILLLDTVIFNGVSLAASSAGRVFISQATAILQEGGAVQKAYCTDVAIIGKTALEDGEILGTVFKEIEQQPEFLVKASVGELVVEAAEDAKVIKLIEEEKLLINETFDLSNKGLIAKRIENLKTTEEAMRKKFNLYMDHFPTLIYDTAGSYQDALIDFYSFKPNNIKKLSGDRGFIGFLSDGRSIAVRNSSTFDTRPTLEFHTKKAKRVVLTEKFRYGEKSCKKN